jgi:hypothetical protein
LHNLDRIIKERANRKARSDWPFDALYHKTRRAKNLLNEIENKVKSRHCIQEARKQFVTSYITAFEVYFKDRFLTLLKIFGYSGLIKQVDVKYSLSEVETILANNITIEDLIVSHYNFQRLDHINEAFSKLFNIKFYEVLKSNSFVVSAKLDPLKVDKYFYKYLKAFIELRHDIVHDINFKKCITRRDIVKYISICDNFVLAVDVFSDIEIKKMSKKDKQQT